MLGRTAITDLGLEANGIGEASAAKLSAALPHATQAEPEPYSNPDPNPNPNPKPNPKRNQGAVPVMTAAAPATAEAIARLCAALRDGGIEWP